MSDLSELGTAALAYAKLGLAVFPTAGKVPRTPRGFHDATTDEAQIREWWIRWPESGIGLPTGARNGLVVVDVDDPEALEAFQRDDGRLPPTEEAITPRGGRHLYFRHPGNGVTVRSCAPFRGYVGLDVRGDGGYVVAPPTPGYQWELDNEDRADLPAVFLETETRRRAEMAADGPRVPVHTRNPTLASYAGSMRRRGMTAPEIVAALLEVNRSRCDPPLEEREVRDIGESIAKYLPSDVPSTRGLLRGQDASNGARAIAASAVKRERVEYLDTERMIPLKAVTVLAGPPGLGKSQWTARLAARNEGVTLIATAEDSLGAVLRPRLEAAGANLDRVRFLVMRRDGMDDGIALPDDVPELDRLVEGTGATLVVIDPLMAHLPERVNSWRDQSIRRALAPLHRLAEKHGCAVVVIVHLNKREGDDPMQRVGGSIGIVGAARSVLLLARDPDDSEGEEGSRRVLAHVKSNYSRLRPSLALRVEPFLVDPEGDHLDTSRIVVEGESHHRGRELLAVVDRDEGKRGEAVAYLLEALHDGPRPAEAVKQEAVARGISEPTLKRAKRDLAIRSSKAGFGKAGPWLWSLAGATPAKEDHRPVSEAIPVDRDREMRTLSSSRTPIGDHADALTPYVKDVFGVEG